MAKAEAFDNSDSSHDPNQRSCSRRALEMNSCTGPILAARRDLLKRYAFLNYFFSGSRTTRCQLYQYSKLKIQRMMRQEQNYKQHEIGTFSL